jgi:hypothetical protein
MDRRQQRVITLKYNLNTTATTTTTTTNNNNNNKKKKKKKKNSIRVYLRANLKAQRPTAKLA